LKEEKIISFEGGKIKILKKDFLRFFPKPREEKEIKEIVEKKLKMKLPSSFPSNFPFGAKTIAKYDQLPISVSSAIFLVKKILEYLPLNKKFLFIGDDDLVSLYLSLTEPNIESLVVDIDEKLLLKIKEISKKFGLKIETRKIDLTKEKKLKENFIGFLTSPVYTFEGVKGFVEFGINQFGKDGGYGFLNLADEAIGNRILFLEEFFFQRNLQIEEIVKGKVFYPWRMTHPEDRVMFRRLKNFFDPKVIKKSPIIGASLWIFNYIPFKVPRPQKQPFYAYL
jgi:predicted methyltransferase